MRHFTNVKDLGDLNIALKEAFEVKANRFGCQETFGYCRRGP